MFPWNIAKSAEAMFSRWAVKRVCKFLLKKKLGQFLLGDIDIEQLDVQLSEGTIQLHDLALNVDFLNKKLGAVASLAIKEGSIGSLLVRMPWKGRGCVVEVDELELVLVPGRESCLLAVGETLHSDKDQGNPYDSGNLGQDMTGGALKSPSGDIHEGVKTVAKMVKWFLTSFNVKLKKLIIAFDPHPEKGGDKSELHRTLVLRVSEIECGTCVSDNPNPEPKDESFLGINRLTNFIQFQGAALELLQLDDDDEDGTTSSPCMSSSFATPIITGEGGGFSGNLKLSIPLKNGSLDIRKVDSDAFIDPVELRFQPNTIKWLSHLCEVFNQLERSGSEEVLHKEIAPGYLNSASYCLASKPVSAAISTNNVVPTCSGSSNKLSSLKEQDSCSETHISGPYLISDWVPLLSNKNTIGTEQELDFGASVDQFFECFDGMRSSQSALGNSGMWNWTCSVFSAITAASSLASGSLYIPSEQQHVETNLKASFAGVSVFLFFRDEDQKFFRDEDQILMPDTKSDQTTDGSHVPFLGAECQDILLCVQVCPQEMKYEGTVKFIEICNFLSYKGDAKELGLREFNERISSQNLYIRQLQEDVQGLLPPLASSTEGSNELTGTIAKKLPFGENQSVVKVTLLKTSGVTRWKFSMKSTSCDGSIVRSAASFEVELPPFVFWVDFSVISMLLEMLKGVSKSLEKQDALSTVMDRKHGSSHGNVKRGSSSNLTNFSTTKSLLGNIVITEARIFLCFPLKSGEDVRSFASWDQFVAVDFQSIGGTVRENHPNFNAAPRKMHSSTDTRSLHVEFGNFDVILINPASDNSELDQSCKKFSSMSILTVTNRTGCLSGISILFQDGNVTGPWIAKKAKSIATCEESRSNFNFVRKDYEFASVSTVNDLEDSNCQTRNEMILSSTIFVHICLSDTTVKLGTLQYRALQSLTDQIISGLSSEASNEFDPKETSSISQTSILVDCSSLEIVISPDVKENIRGSMQSELPGSWQGLKLQIQKFTLLSVSDIGGISGANFFWLAHAEGKLWGSVTSVPDKEFLLISCDNSAMKRGDGGGSNALSSRLAGCDIVHLWDPESFHDFTSVTLRCGTIIAVGGRLDWLDVISSFFSAPTETEKENDVSKQKGNLNASSGASVVLNFVDIGLSYEPYPKNLVVKSEALDSESRCPNANQETDEENVACLLAASFLHLSNSSLADSVEKEFKIRVQDLGLLICVVSKSENVIGSYNAMGLQKIGYVKVAQEALVEAILRTNCKSGLLWEMECSKSHIYVETCHDTTSSLIRLAAQLQQLFAPDMEESLVHLQNRWNRVQQEQEEECLNDVGSRPMSDTDSSPSISEIFSSTMGIQSEPGLTGLMDEICEDAFQIDNTRFCQYDSSVSRNRSSAAEGLLRELGPLSLEAPKYHGPCFDGSMPLAELGSSQTPSSQESNFPDLIEHYCFPELQPSIDLSVSRQSSYETPKDNSDEVNYVDFGKVSSGWYMDASLKIVEDHISEVGNNFGMQKFEETRFPSIGIMEANGLRKPIGCVFLKNIDVRWRMDAGSDWQDYTENGQRGKDNGGRDTTGCLELTLSGIEFKYEAFPVGGLHVSKLALSVKDFHLYDISQDAPWKMVLGYYDSKGHPRKSSSKAFKLDLEAVRPDPLIPLEEYRLRVAFLPMRLHLHQSQLDFLIGFFGAKSSSVDQPQDSNSSNVMPLKSNDNLAEHNVVDEALLPYFQSFDIWPILVRVDYSPCRVDLAALRGGKYVELVNLVPWKGVELQLKHVHGIGIYGWANVCEMAGGEWLEDISQNQVHKILRGLQPIRSVVALGAGAAKLVTLPVKSYKKDKRVLKGMQRGISAFLRSISVEAIGLGVHLAAGAHDILVQAEYMVSNSVPSVPRPIPRKVQKNVRSNQPKDAQQGIQQACESLSSGLEKSASALVQTPLKKYQRGAGAGSALAAAVRAVPTAAIAPASACAGAVHYALLGFRNSLDPERKKESMEKYLGPSQPWEQK